MLAGKELKAFEGFQRMLEGTSSLSHKNPHDYDKMVELIVDLYRNGSKWSDLNVDLVRHWAESRGWPKDDAHGLGEMCETIYHTLRYIGQIPA